MEQKSNSEDFIREITRRRIEYLVHFTPTINLYSICEQKKVMSRAILEGLDTEQFDILDYVQFTDSIRYDDKNYINLSISGTNTFLFNKFRVKTRDNMTINWCILKIDRKHIYDRSTLFSVTNAASNAAKKNGISGSYEKFQQLFAHNIDMPYGIRGQILDKFTTNVQAEVLVKDAIPVESIQAVCFENYSGLVSAKKALYEFDTSNFIVDKDVFSTDRSV